MTNRNKIIAELEAEQMKSDVPEFGPGDTVVVQVKVTEGNRTRLQAYEGVVIGRRNRGVNSAFTVRKISDGVGVERTFQLHSQQIDINERLENEVKTVASPADIMRITQENSDVRVDDKLIDYINKVVRLTRKWPQFHMGASPRAGLSLMQGARTLAAFNHRLSRIIWAPVASSRAR